MDSEDQNDIIKKKEWLRADAPDNWVFNTFFKVNSNSKELIDKYFEDWDEEILYEAGLKEYDAAKFTQDMVKWPRNILWGAAESVSQSPEFVWKGIALAAWYTAKKLWANKEKTDALVWSYFNERDTLGGETIGDKESGLYKWTKTAADVAQLADVALPLAKWVSTAYKGYKAAKAAKALEWVDKWVDVLNNRATKAFWDFIQPAQTASTIKKRRKTNEIVPKTLFWKAKVIPTDKDIEMIKDTFDVVKPKLWVDKNLVAVREGIVSEAEYLKNLLKDNSFTFNKIDIEDKFNLLEKSPLIVWDIEKTHAAVQSKFFDILSSKKNNLDGLLDARKDFDRYVEKYFGDIWRTEKFSPIKQTVADVRGVINDFIASKFPGNYVWESLRRQKNLYKVQDNLISKTNNLSKYGEFTKKYKNVLQPLWYAAWWSATVGVINALTK